MFPKILIAEVQHDFYVNPTHINKSTIMYASMASRKLVIFHLETTINQSKQQNPETMKFSVNLKISNIHKNTFGFSLTRKYIFSNRKEQLYFIAWTYWTPDRVGVLQLLDGSLFNHTLSWIRSQALLNLI